MFSMIEMLLKISVSLHIYRSVKCSVLFIDFMKWPPFGICFYDSKCEFEYVGHEFNWTFNQNKFSPFIISQLWTIVWQKKEKKECKLKVNWNTTYNMSFKIRLTTTTTKKLLTNWDVKYLRRKKSRCKNKNVSHISCFVVNEI